MLSCDENFSDTNCIQHVRYRHRCHGTMSNLGLWPTTSNSTCVSPMRRIGKATAGDAWQCHSGSWPDPEPRHAETAARTHVPSSTLPRNVTLGLGASSTRAVPQEEHRKDTAAPYCCVGTPCHTSHHCCAPMYSDPHYDHKSPRRPAGSAMQCDSTWRALWSTSSCPKSVARPLPLLLLGGRRFSGVLLLVLVTSTLGVPLAAAPRHRWDMSTLTFARCRGSLCRGTRGTLGAVGRGLRGRGRWYKHL